MKMVGVLIMDLGKCTINAIAKACGCCWRYAKKAYEFVKNNNTEQLKLTL